MPSLASCTVRKPRVFSVFKQITTIGRARTNDVAISHPTLANHHAHIVFDGKEFGFAELDRDAPILWNGKKKRRGSLQHQDRLTLGSVELVFSLFDESLPKDEPEAVRDEGLRGAELVGMRELAELVRRLAELRRSDRADERPARCRPSRRPAPRRASSC